MSHYERLSALDASFLEIEDQSTHMHVAAALIFEPGRLATAEGGLDSERIRAYIGSRLHLIPRYRQRLAYIPFEHHPVWVDDDRFNIFYHVRHSSLPRPGSERQLKRLCGRILSQKLDLTKPLWEIWVVEGLSEGRFALITKVHHCMVDGISGVDLLNVILSATDEESFAPAPPWRARPAPGAGELVAGELWRRATGGFRLARAAAGALAQPRRSLAQVCEAAGGVVELLGEMTPGSDTPLNRPLGPHRRFDWLRLDLHEMKAVKNTLGGTLNDVVLATVVGALRRFLRGSGVNPEGLDFRLLIPVSVRATDQRGRLGNRVAQLIARAPLEEVGPRARYEKIVAMTRRLKGSHQVAASELFAELSDWTATAVLSQTMRLAAARRNFNLVVTNVPGPPLPLFLLGARMCASYPMVPLFSRQGLGIALFSYCDGLYWGISGDWDTVPELHAFIEDLGAAFEELRETAGLATVAARASA
ncbi:MAG TPA: wax ester/triacylglycerol synthase family O-acyltransferase [Candidatus Bathyarchaeia archaeon]|nr:wax ester/triacylglycerol synthase family O-acyltransferase [Candidatus Bathyarchaeia archaeon]